MYNVHQFFVHCFVPQDPWFMYMFNIFRVLVGKSSSLYALLSIYLSFISCYLSTLHVLLSIYLPFISCYLSIYLSVFLSIYLPYKSHYLFTLHISLSICPTCLVIYLSTLYILLSIFPTCSDIYLSYLWGRGIYLNFSSLSKIIHIYLFIVLLSISSIRNSLMSPPSLVLFPLFNLLYIM